MLVNSRCQVCRPKHIWHGVVHSR